MNIFWGLLWLRIPSDTHLRWEKHRGLMMKHILCRDMVIGHWLRRKERDLKSLKWMVRSMAPWSHVVAEWEVKIQILVNWALGKHLEFNKSNIRWNHGGAVANFGSVLDSQWQLVPRHVWRGVVVNVGDFGVFADIGFEQNVILAIPRRHEQTDLYSWCLELWNLIDRTKSNQSID